MKIAYIACISMLMFGLPAFSESLSTNIQLCENVGQAQKPISEAPVAPETMTKWSSETPLAMASSINFLSGHLYRVFSRENNENILFSPTSIGFALIPLYFGLSGSAAEEVASAAHFGFSNSTAIEKAASFLSASPKLGEGITYQIANAIFLASGPELSPSFTNQWPVFKSSEFGVVRFSGSSDLCNKANFWVAQATSGLIQTIIDPPTPQNCLIMIANAIYFKGMWEYPFPAAATYIGTFTVAPGKEVPAKFMSLRKEIWYSAGQNFQVIELPYKGRRYAMNIVLPAPGYRLNELEANIDALAVRILSRRFCKFEVIVDIPKFRFRASHKMSERFKALGIKEAFLGTDFSGILKAPMPAIALSEVLHNAIIDVDESGTKAAAVTAILAVGGSVGGKPPPPIVVKADRPFLFFIVDKFRRSILFLGRVMKPNQESIGCR